MKKVLTLDVEVTMYKHQERGEDGLYNPSKKMRMGQSSSLPQWLVMSGWKWRHKETAETIRHIANKEYNRKYIQGEIDSADLLVGFNIKFDLLWLKRIEIDISNITIWDCQLAEWMLNNQNILGKNSLNDACERYGFPPKIDVIENDYWSKGIDTDEIPSSILAEYLEGDLDRTERVFLEQVKRFKQTWIE